MKHTTLGALGVVALLGLSLSRVTPAGDAEPAATTFQELKLHFEVDLPTPWSVDSPSTAPPASWRGLRAELVLEAVAEDGLRELRMSSSSGQRVFGLACPNARTLGVAELTLECQADRLDQALLEYPPGEYFVEGTTLDGAPVAGTVRLSHEFPGPFAVVSPLPGAAVAAESATFAWTASRGAVRYVLEVERDETGFQFEITLPPGRTTFALPPGVLAPGEEYEYSLLVQGDTDNELEVEGSFFTFP